MHYLLFYDLAPDYMTRRDQYRAEHLRLAREAHERGELVFAGALQEPVDQAVFVFTSQEAAEAYAKGDPYVAAGIVQQWRVRKWFTVVGPGTTAP